LVGVLVLGLGVLGVAQHRKIQRLNATIAAAAKPAAPVIPAVVVGSKSAHSSDAATTERRTTPSAPRREEGKKGEAVVRLEVANPSTPSESGAEAIPAIQPLMTKSSATPPESEGASVATNESPLAAFGKMMKSPRIKEMTREILKGQMDVSYGALFKYLQLSDAEQETLKGLLIEKKMVTLSNDFNIMGQMGTREEMVAEGKRMADAIGAVDVKVKEFLGSEKYAVYHSFEETQPERMEVTALKGLLKPGDQMTEEQEDKLIRAMHSERTNLHHSVGLDDESMASLATQFAPEQIAKRLEEAAKLQAKYLARAATILTPSQLEQFKVHQEQSRALEEMAQKMAARMLAPSETKPSAGKP
jgi:hypothetical protein